MESVFGRRKKEETKDGLTCPLCTLENPLSAESCSRCYYDFTVGTHQQSRSSDEKVVNSLLNELNAEVSDSEEDGIDVDWTGHSFDMSDLSVEVSDYGDSEDVTVSSTVGFARQLVSNEEVGSEEEEEDYTLTSDDAPSSVEKFVVPEGEEEDLSIPEPTRIAIVDPVSKEGPGMDEDLLTADWSESDTAPVLPQNETDEMEPPPDNSVPTSMPVMPAMPAVNPESIETVTPPESESQDVSAPPPAVESHPVAAPPPEAFANTNPASLPTLPGAPPPVQPNVQPAPQPSIPAMPIVPSAPSPSPATTPVAVPMPNLPTAPVAPPGVASASPLPLWPWPQAEPWDDRLLAGKVKNAMEAAKMNRKEEAVLILDEIGPHLGDRTRLMLYIGALLKSLGRSDDLSSMLEIARKDYTDDEHVLAALKQLS
ncbi:MAG TPA: hypothetical protein D7H94_04525 [Candidatus Poseidoniales archaeon]|nr:MAG TPA: hypothetical protein D7H94_04525 [Candidatus Poseidoniales archaeon]